MAIAGKKIIQDVINLRLGVSLKSILRPHFWKVKTVADGTYPILLNKLASFDSKDKLFKVTSWRREFFFIDYPNDTETICIASVVQDGWMKYKVTYLGQNTRTQKLGMVHSIQNALKLRVLQVHHKSQEGPTLAFQASGVWISKLLTCLV